MNLFSFSIRLSDLYSEKTKLFFKSKFTVRL
jgi:hypothetical protein